MKRIIQSARVHMYGKRNSKLQTKMSQEDKTMMDTTQDIACTKNDEKSEKASVIYVKISKDLKSEQLIVKGHVRPNCQTEESNTDKEENTSADNSLNPLPDTNSLDDEISSIDRDTTSTHNPTSTQLDMMEYPSPKYSTVTAEILWTLKTVTSGYSFRSCYGLSGLFKNMFPDSQVASNFAYTKDKFSYLLSHAIAPYFKSLLLQDLKQSDFYVITLDDNPNNSSRSEHVEFNITYWKSSTKRAETRYLNSSFLPRTGVANLIAAFYDSSISLDESKVLQVSMMGARANWKFLKALGENREDEKYPKLINIGNCNAHILHGAFRSGAEKTGWRYKERLKSLFSVLNETPVNRFNYSDITGSTVFPQKFCDTHWLENCSVAQRAIDIWDNVCKFMNFWELLPFSKQSPPSSNLLAVQKIIKDKTTLAKLHFFCYVAKMLTSFLTTYQVSKPMVPFLYDDLYNLVLKLMAWFIKSDILCEASTAVKLCAINLHDRSNYVKLDCVNIGFGAENYLRFCLREELLSESDIKSFKEGCVVFLIELIEHIRQQSCLRSSIARNAGSINPNKMVSHTDSSKMLFSRLIEKLAELRWLSEMERDKALFQYEEYMSKVVSLNKKQFEAFSKTYDRLDEFFFTRSWLTAYPILKKVIKLIVCLNHGRNVNSRFKNAKNNYITDTNVSKACIRSERIVIDHMDAMKLTPEAFQITTELVKQFIDEREKYQICINAMKAKKEDEIKKLQKMYETNL